MEENNYRIRVNVGSGENVVRVNLKQGVKTLNVLSLEINPEDTYELQSANYGVIIGRVLANDAFGVPNVKVSVFVPISDIDKDNYVISSQYPYITPQSSNADNVKYNLVTKRKNSPGTFPTKRMVLDNQGTMEVFDKYWKYTTVTNESGDYMLFGVPTGTCQVHYDCDLSDIGIISQHPYDFVAKGYDRNLFKSISKFDATNFTSAVHIISQDNTVYVYPFWGDKEKMDIGITRYDIKIDYKFEPSCIFMGSSITDPNGTYISTNGKPNTGNGRFASLTTTTGDIEVIRKTFDGKVEELKDNVKGIIDGNGVWCYQIPMNLDRIGTDEFGNRITINDPNKGIPTRARVRFRISLDAGNTAKMLVPCNPPLKNSVVGNDNIMDPLPVGINLVFSGNSVISEDISQADDYYDKYEFGSKTPDEHFRDLYWGKVYSVKQYYPRFQYEDKPKAVFPQNKRVDWANLKDGQYGVVSMSVDDRAKDYTLFGYPPQFSFNQSCISSIESFNGVNIFPYTTMYSAGEVGIDNKIIYYFFYKMTDLSTNSESLVDKGLHFCFENDWINGCLYFPKVEIVRRNDGTLDYFGVKNDLGYGEYDNVYLSGRHHFNWSNANGCFTTIQEWLTVNSRGGKVDDNQVINTNKLSIFSRCPLKHGIITKNETIYGDDVFYYRCGTVQYADSKNMEDHVNGLKTIDNITPDSTVGGSTYIYRRLYSTDIILLGNLEDIYDHLPKLYESLPITTATFPPIAPDKQLNESGMSKIGYFEQARLLSDTVDLVDIYGNTEDSSYNDIISDYGEIPLYKVARQEVWSDYNGDNEINSGITYHYMTDGNDWNTERLLARVSRCYSVFFGINTWGVEDTLVYDIPTFINTSRICELDVHNDKSFYTTVGVSGGYTQNLNIETVTIPTNGMIDVYDISTNENRSAFATMNRGIKKYLTDSLGNRKPFIEPMVINGFDGRLKKYINNEESINERDINKNTRGTFLFSVSGNLITHATDEVDDNYMEFRFGNKSWPYRQCEVMFEAESQQVTIWDLIRDAFWGSADYNYAHGPLYLPENSFYFYFGLRTGFSALDALRERYIGYGEDEEADSAGGNTGAIQVYQDKDNYDCISGQQVSNCIVVANGISLPATYEIYKGTYLIREGSLSSEPTGTTITDLYVGVYKIKISDSLQNEYETTFTINRYGPSISYKTDYERTTDRPMITFESVDGLPIRVFSSHTNSDFYVYTGQYHGSGYYDYGYNIIFDTQFVDLSHDYTEFPPVSVYFAEGTQRVQMTVDFMYKYDTSETGFKFFDCFQSVQDVMLKNSFNVLLGLNGVPVKYIRGWSEPNNSYDLSSDDPDSVFVGPTNESFNVWESLRTLMPTINERTYKFEDESPTGEPPTYDKQLSYLSNMFAAVCGDNNMTLNNDGDTTNIILATLSPDYAGVHSEHYEYPELNWGENHALSGDSIQKTTIDGTVYKNKSIPQIVGLNYPTSIECEKTLMTSGSTGETYINNETMYGKFDDPQQKSIFGINMFGCRDKSDPNQDEPSSGILPTISSETTCSYDIQSKVKNLFGVRTVDNRFDYQFVSETPLVLPSGYSNFNNLERSSIECHIRTLGDSNTDLGELKGGLWVDLYGGFRLNYNEKREITSFYMGDDGVIKGRPQRYDTVEGANDGAKLYSVSFTEDGNDIPMDDENINIWYNGIDEIPIDVSQRVSGVYVYDNSDNTYVLKSGGQIFGSYRTQDINVKPGEIYFISSHFITPQYPQNLPYSGAYQVLYWSGNTVTDHKNGSGGDNEAKKLYITIPNGVDKISVASYMPYDNYDFRVSLRRNAVEIDNLYYETIGIDHVQFSPKSGSTLGYGYNGLSARFVGCNSNFKSGYVSQGDSMTIGISYNSGVEFMRGDGEYEILYNLEFNENTQTIYPIIDPSILKIQLSPDSMTDGVTYTDLSAQYSDSIHNNYPGWVYSGLTEAPNIGFNVYYCYSNYEIGNDPTFEILGLWDRDNVSINIERISEEKQPSYDDNQYVFLFDANDSEPIDDEMSQSYVYLSCEPSEPSFDISNDGFIYVPTLKIYKDKNETTLLKQGVSLKNGYAYFAGSITYDYDDSTNTLTLQLYTPLREEDDTVNYNVSALTESGSCHTIGNVVNIVCKDAESVEYDASRCEIKAVFQNNIAESSSDLYFDIENGLRYLVKINGSDVPPTCDVEPLTPCDIDSAIGYTDSPYCDGETVDPGVIVGG